MSGIVCLFDRGRGDAAREDVSRMLDRISHRGPDGSGSWCDDHVGLGHQQLQTTPEGTYDEQPYRDGNSVVTADARIDNRGELISELSLTDPPERIPDSRLLLAAYRKWGEQCVHHLVGAFAFVVWDGDSNTVFCARDHFGVKPLYYHEGDDTFAGASEVKALLSLPFVSGELDELKIGDFLMDQFEDKQNTYYGAIRRLPPAHAMRVGADGTDRWQYWDLDPARTITLESDAAYERRFRELFEQAVECRLRTDDEVGADLSGGLDSTAVTVMAHELLWPEKTLHTYSNVFDEAPSSDEREFIETVIDRPGLSSHYVFPDRTGVLVDIDEVLQYFDEPMHNPMHFAKWKKVKQIRADGIGVHLTGALGDSAVDYGLGWLPELLRTGHLFQLHEVLRSMGDVLGASPRRLFVQRAFKPLVPEWMKRTRKRLHGTPVLAEAENRTLDPSFVDQFTLQARYKSVDRTGSALKRSARRWQRRSLFSGRLTATFETVDQVHAAFGIEPRHPFTDKRLVEFSLAIPPSQQLADGYTRSIIRRSLDDLLPDKVQWRPWKTMLNESFWNALNLEDEHLQRMVANPGPTDDYIDANALRDAYDRFSESPSPQDARDLWKALALFVWLSNVDSSSVRKR